MKTFTLLAIAAVCGLATAAPAERVRVYGGVEAFNWQEFDQDGVKLLEESGPLFSVGVRVDPTPNKLSPWVRAELFGGAVDYDGQRQNGEPVQDRTGYFGSDARIGLALPVYKVDGGNAALCAILGGGARNWIRSLGLDDDEGGGYDEFWTVLHGRAGLGWFALRGKELAWYAEAGLSYPFYALNRIEFDTDELGEEELEPEGAPGFYAETGLTRGRLFVAAFLETERFDKSDDVNRVVPVDDGSDRTVTLTVFQPESERVTVGLRAGVAF